ncbi:MAG: hypothetical protein J6S29_07450 [Methanosphaera sp.]|uniref:hypothetical protein n=1 Tax=Methanosphaera sp. BMS TaxID=1789762 RepID=UPI000DC1DC32|nr:hypothetical protein [Methanosphaera sp. BMS]AWX32154.1 hypothetical protein AW729_03140 [Methanosphaera sp. BMS]MBO7719969.1 hypothetical protein [Methanosphaera sp.]
MLYKYHVAIIKDDMVVCDKYYQENEKPTDETYQKLKNQYEADQIFLNTVDDDELESFIKEEIKLE